MYLVACDHPSRRDEVVTALTDILRGCTQPGDLALYTACILEDVATAEAIAAIAEANARDLLYGEFYGVADAIVEGTGWQWSTFERNPMQHFGPGGTLDHLRERQRRIADARLLAEATVRPAVARTAPKVGRNDACPCGSGKKYKKCCGAASVAMASTTVARRP
nr:SEC-C domain-containing protein [Deltaproteobacteria bacterium]